MVKGGRYKHIRKDITSRKLPERRRLPVHRRKHVPYYMGRWYGSYNTYQNTIKRYGFQVMIPESMNHQAVRRSIAITQQKLKSNTLPMHKQGQVFSSFGELFQRTDWIRVRKIRVNRPNINS